MRMPPLSAYSRERWTTPDGDFIDVDWGGDARAERLVVLFHGLEGNSASHYARALAQAASARGWRLALPHFRGCSGEPNLLPRAYHSGDSAEVDWLLHRFSARAAPSALYAVGVSLGGNVLLKWLGERGCEATRIVRRAVAVSAPLDLPAAGNALDRGFNREVYTRAFLISLKRKALAKLTRFPDLFDARAVRTARTLRAFDNAVTAPLHGFRNTDDYWARASCGPWLARISLPTLVLNARNDPFLPVAALESVQRSAAPSVVLESPATGGHVGFVEGPFPGRRWLPRRILEFLSAS